MDTERTLLRKDLLPAGNWIQNLLPQHHTVVLRKYSGDSNWTTQLFDASAQLKKKINISLLIQKQHVAHGRFPYILQHGQTFSCGLSTEISNFSLELAGLKDKTWQLLLSGFHRRFPFKIRKRKVSLQQCSVFLYPFVCICLYISNTGVTVWFSSSPKGFKFH